MLFPTLNFAIFFMITFLVAWALNRRHQAKLYFLIGASYVFYGFWDWRFCFLLFLSSTANWSFGWLVHNSATPARKKQIVSVAVAANLGVLACFKYFDFFIES